MIAAGSACAAEPFISIVLPVTVVELAPGFQVPAILITPDEASVRAPVFVLCRW